MSELLNNDHLDYGFFSIISYSYGSLVPNGKRFIIGQIMVYFATVIKGYAAENIYGHIGFGKRVGVLLFGAVIFLSSPFLYIVQYLCRTFLSFVFHDINVIFFTLIGTPLSPSMLFLLNSGTVFLLCFIAIGSIPYSEPSAQLFSGRLNVKGLSDVVFFLIQGVVNAPRAQYCGFRKAKMDSYKGNPSNVGRTSKK